MANYQGYGPMKGLRVDSDSEDQKVWKKKTGGPATGNTGQSIGAMDQMLKGMFNPKPIPKKDPPPEKKPEEKKPEKKEIKVQEKQIKKPTPPPTQPAVTKPKAPEPVPVKQNILKPIPPPAPPKEDDNRIPQPEPYIFPSGIPQNQARIPVTDDLFNRPGYIRKLKKVADNYNFNQFNKANTEVNDVLRLSECYYDEIKKRKQSQFQDYEFPANYTAFVDNIKQKTLGSFIDYNNWQSAQATFKGPCFGKYIDPNDIERGAFHTEYLVSCLSSLAESEANVKKLIEEQTLTKSNFYYVRLNENGVWRYIVVDDQVPSEKSGKLAISHSYADNETQLWPSLIEKAYTKLYGSFEQYSRNQSRQSYLRDLTGAPVRTYLPTSTGLVDRVRKAIQLGYVVQAVPQARIQQKGLNPNLTLSVVGVNNRGSYEIRNSFGTIDQKSKLNISKEGVFEFNQNDAAQNIAYFLIAEVHNSYATSTVQCKMKKSFYSSYSFKIKKDFHGYLSVSQFDERLFPKSENVFTEKSNIVIENPSQYSYSPVRALIYQRQRNGTYTYVNSGYSDRKAFDIEVNLDAGQYVVLIIALWNAEWFDLNFSLYGTELVSFKKVYNKFDPSIIAKGLQEDSLLSGAKTSRSGVEEIVYLHEQSGLIVVTVNNTTGRETRHTKDFGRAKVDNLYLLSAKSKGETLNSLSKADLSAYKTDAFQDKQWWVDLAPGEKFSWVFATQSQFDDSAFKSLGGR